MKLNAGPLDDGSGGLPRFGKPASTVTITDIDVPFGRMVIIAIKWTAAAIPAAILVLIVAALVSGMLR
jgi:hypothetical protein